MINILAAVTQGIVIGVGLAQFKVGQADVGTFILLVNAPGLLIQCLVIYAKMENKK